MLREDKCMQDMLKDYKENELQCERSNLKFLKCALMHLVESWLLYIIAIIGPVTKKHL